VLLLQKGAFLMQGLYLAEWVTKRRDNWLTAEGNLIYFTLQA
jgi:hypothetical protein